MGGRVPSFVERVMGSYVMRDGARVVSKESTIASNSA